MRDRMRPRKRQDKRHWLQICSDVTFALFLRELKTRFGRYRLGIMWALLEPLAFIVIMSVIRSLMGREDVHGVAMHMFFMLGYVPFKYFSSLMTQSAAAIRANRGLFSYRQVRPFDAIAARVLLETLIHFLVIVTLMLLFVWLGESIELYDPLLAVCAFLLNGMLGAGMGLIICIGQFRVSELAKIVPLLTRPLFFISGLFFSVSDIPASYHSYLLWNPLLHTNEIMRGAFYRYYPTELVSLSYVAACATVALLLGLAVYRLDWKRLVTS